MKQCQCRKFVCCYYNYGKCTLNNEICKHLKGYDSSPKCEKYGSCELCNSTDCEYAYELRLQKRQELDSLIREEEKKKPTVIKIVEDDIKQTKTIKDPREKKAAPYKPQIPKQANTNANAYAFATGDFHNGKYGYAAILVINGEYFKLANTGQDPIIINSREMAGKVMGAMSAMSLAKKHKVQNLILYYDFEGIEKWATGKWNCSKELTKRYRAFFKKCNLNITFDNITNCKDYALRKCTISELSKAYLEK